MTSVIDLSEKSTSELLAIYNEQAAVTGAPIVKRFADRAAALKRTTAILGGPAAIAEAASAEAAETIVNEIAQEAGATSSVQENDTSNDNATETASAKGEATEQEKTDMAAKKKTAKKAAKKTGAKKTSAKKKTGGGAKAGVKKPRADADKGELVGKGSNRDKLLTLFEKNKGKQVPISKMMMAVYGEAHKDLKGPVMMVLKGLLIVFKANKLKLEIRKTRENKENHFGLYAKA